jgi:hypothetical protein
MSGIGKAMTDEKTNPAKISPANAAGAGRKVEEVDFTAYVRRKQSRKYMEEIDIGDYLKKKKADDAL